MLNVREVSVAFFLFATSWNRGEIVGEDSVRFLMKPACTPNQHPKQGSRSRRFSPAHNVTKVPPLSLELCSYSNCVVRTFFFFRKTVSLLCSTNETLRYSTSWSWKLCSTGRWIPTREMVKYLPEGCCSMSTFVVLYVPWWSGPRPVA